MLCECVSVRMHERRARAITEGDFLLISVLISSYNKRNKIQINRHSWVTVSKVHLQLTEYRFACIYFVSILNLPKVHSSNSHSHSTRPKWIKNCSHTRGLTYSNPLCLMLFFFSSFIVNETDINTRVHTCIWVSLYCDGKIANVSSDSCFICFVFL